MAGPVRISILADGSQASRAFSSVSGDANTMGSKVAKAGKLVGAAAVAGLAVAGAAAVKFGIDSVKAASDAQQSLGATETVFGKFSDSVVKASEGAAQKFGLSANQYRENANLLGALFKNQGVALKDLGGATDSMIGKASDLAATFGGTTSDAVGALSSAFKGEFDSLEKYGVSLKESTVQAELAARGQDGLTGSALAAAKQQAITDLIFKQSKDSLGAFGRESDTLAGQQQRLSAQFEDVKAKVGQALLPVLTQFFGYLNDTALPALSAIGGYIQDNFAPAFERIRDVVSNVLNGTSGDVSKFTGDLTSIFRDAVTIVTELWDTFGSDITRYAEKTFQNLKQIIGGALDVIAGIFKTVASLLKGDWRGAWDGIKQITSGAKDVVVGVVKQLFNILQTVVSAGWKAIKGLFSAAWDGLKELVSSGIDKVVGFVKALPGRITSAVSGAFDGIKEAFRSAINFVIDAWNRLSFTIPAVKVLGKTVFDGTTISPPDIQRLARGGITTGPTVAMIGDNPGGREAVIPLDRYDLSGGAQLVPLIETLIDEIRRQTKAGQADTKVLAEAMVRSNVEAGVRFGQEINGAASSGARRARSY